MTRHGFIIQLQKQNARVWCEKHQVKVHRKKVKVTHSAGKVMVTIFWYSSGVLQADNPGKGATIDADKYHQVMAQLRATIKRKRPGLLPKKFFCFMTTLVPILSKTLKIYFPYSSGKLLVICRIHLILHQLFPQLKAHLGGE